MIDKFISALSSTFTRDRLLDDIRITYGELTELQPAYNQAAALLKNWSFKSPDVKNKMAQFKRMTSTGSDNPIVVIQKKLPVILENLKTAEDQAMIVMGNVIATAGLTLQQATIVQYCDAIFLVSKYARKFLNYVYVLETREYGDEHAGTSAIPAKELEWLDKTFVDFCTAFNAATGEPKQVLASIEGIPAVEIGRANLQSLKSTLGEKKMDPLQMGFLTSNYNPVYFVRKLVAEWQVRRYKEMQEELTLLQLRRANLEKLKNGKPDAALDKQIQVVEGRVQDLTYALAEMESDL